MRKDNYLAWLGIAAAAGAGLGIIVDRKHPAKGCFLGAAAGVVAGSFAAGILQCSEEKVPYYSKSDPLYEENTTV